MIKIINLLPVVFQTHSVKQKLIFSRFLSDQYLNVVRTDSAVFWASSLFSPVVRSRTYFYFSLIAASFILGLTNNADLSD